MAIHHIRDEDVADAPWWHDVARPVLEPWPRRVALAAHRATFEEQFCTPALTQGADWICTWKCALRLWPDSPSFSNQVLRYWRKPAGLVHERGLPAHRAFPDAYVTAHHLRDQLNEASVAQLIEWSKRAGPAAARPLRPRSRQGLARDRGGEPGRLPDRPRHRHPLHRRNRDGAAARRRRSSASRPRRTCCFRPIGRKAIAGVTNSPAARRSSDGARRIGRFRGFGRCRAQAADRLHGAGLRDVSLPRRWRRLADRRRTAEHSRAVTHTYGVELAINRARVAYRADRNHSARFSADREQIYLTRIASISLRPGRPRPDRRAGRDNPAPARGSARVAAADRRAGARSANEPSRWCEPARPTRHRARSTAKPAPDGCATSANVATR